MAKKKFSLEEIFENDEFGLLESQEKKNVIKTDEDRLIDVFQEINAFFEKNQREPGKTMSEYSLKSRLKSIREDEDKKKILKPFDRFDLLGHVEIEKPTLDEIFESDDSGLLEQSEDLSIFEFKHTPKPDERAEADFVARRKPLKEKEFTPYEAMFQKVHKELKEGKRKLKPFRNIEKNLHIGNFYIMDGIMLYLESANLKESEIELNSGNRVRKEGRTRTIFENGTYSNMYYRSLGKQIQKNGKLITNTDDAMERELLEQSNVLNEEDVESGWIYVLSSKSNNPGIANIDSLHKIGYSKIEVEKRIKNASKEATYLFADVKIESTYKCYNLDTNVFENLIHRFFAEACLNVDIETPTGQRMTPREWFVVPLNVIDEAIKLIINGNIVDYVYDINEKAVKLK